HRRRCGVLRTLDHQHAALSARGGERAPARVQVHGVRRGNAVRPSASPAAGWQSQQPRRLTMNAIRPHRAWITTAALLSLFSLSIHAQAQSDNAIPRTASGQPLLQGYWTSSTVVPFERPQELGDQAFYTEEEAQERL